MSIIHLEKRLRALEGTSGAVDECKRPFMGAINLLMLLVAAHLGDFNGREAVVDAYARALGYASKHEFKQGLTAGSGTEAFDEFNRRRTEATVRLLETKDAPINEGRQVRDALRDLFAELPEAVRHHPFAREVDGCFDEAMEWLCL